MKKIYCSFFITLVLTLFGTKAFAFDIIVENADGVIIGYNYINNGVELEVAGINDCGSVVIPDKVTYKNTTLYVTSIGQGAFYGHSNIISITIPNSVTRIGNCAFAGCSGLTSFTIPNSVTSIGNGVFESCTGLTTITIPNSITSIGEKVFSGCSGLTSITIPNSITCIGYYAFAGCGLTSITIPNSVTCIENYAFWRCSDLTSITISNSVTSIGNYAFAFCGLTSITIPNSITSISNGVFQSCTGLTSITIPNSITSIGNGAFQSCTGLTSIKIPNSVTFIDNAAFYECSNLSSITIPNSVESIGWDVFSRCSGLISVVIGESVKSIGTNSFAHCQQLTDVYCLAQDRPNTSINDFNDSNIENATLYVPAALLNDYLNTEPWKNFKEIVPITKPKHTLTYLVDGKVYKEYEIEEDDVITPEAEPTNEGYTFSGWSKIPMTMPTHDVTVTGFFYKKGDAHSDNLVNAADIEEIANYILGNPSERFNIIAADMNGDGDINVLDIVLIVDTIKETE